MTAASRISSEIANLGCVGNGWKVRWRRQERQRLRCHHIFGVKRRFFPYSHSACLAEPSPPLLGTFPIGKERRTVVLLSRHTLQTNARSQDHGEMFRINTRRFGFLTQCTTSLKAGMSDRVPLRFPHLSFIRLEPYPARFARHLPHARKAFRFFPLEMHFPTLFHTASALSAPMWYLPRGADDTRETCHRRPSGIARFILRRSRHHNPEP